MLHSKTPWSIYTSNSVTRISSESDGDVLRASVAVDGHPILVVSKENARRIVASVNAMEGIPIEFLEAIPGAPASLVPMYVELERERDSAIDALKACVAFLRSGFPSCSAGKEIEQAELAINSIRIKQ